MTTTTKTEEGRSDGPEGRSDGPLKGRSDGPKFSEYFRLEAIRFKGFGNLLMHPVPRPP